MLKGITPLWIVVIFVCLILVLIIGILISVPTNADPIDRTIAYFPGIEKNHTKRNCSLEKIYSMSDEECRNICINPNMYVSNNGLCVNILTFDQKLISSKCDPTKGVLAYLLGDAQLGSTTVKCLSIDDGVQPDDVDKPNQLCANGYMNVDYTESFPQITNCTCYGDDDTKVIVPNTSVVRTKAVCVKNQLLPLFYENNLIYSSKIIY